MSRTLEYGVPFPEARELVRLARGFITGEVHFSAVCSAAVALCDAARLYSAAPEISRMGAEWATMAGRAWPEMMPIENPITEEEFRDWVKKQLAVLEPQMQGADDLSV